MVLVRAFMFVGIALSLTFCTSEVQLGEKGGTKQDPGTFTSTIPCSDKLPGFLTLDLKGGAALAGFDFAPLDADSNTLSDYTLMGQPLGSGYTLNHEFGVPYFLDKGHNAATPVDVQSSHFILGMLSKISAAARSKIKIFGVAVKTPAHAELPMNASDLVYRAGANGIFLRTRTGLENTASGGKATLPPTPVSPYLAISQVGKAEQTAARTECSNEHSLEPSVAVVADNHPSATLIYGLPTSSIVNNAFANLSFNAVTGYSGPGTMALGGYAYNGSTRDFANGRHKLAGEHVGRAIALASALNRPLYIAIVTDGGITTNSLDPQTPSSNHSYSVGIYFDPSGTAKLSKKQIGSFRSLPFIVDTTTPVGSDPMNIAFIHFVNWLNVAGLMETLSALMQSPNFPQPNFSLTEETAKELIAFE